MLDLRALNTGARSQHIAHDHIQKSHKCLQSLKKIYKCLLSSGMVYNLSKIRFRKTTGRVKIIIPLTCFEKFLLAWYANHFLVKTVDQWCFPVAVMLFAVMTALIDGYRILLCVHIVGKKSRSTTVFLSLFSAQCFNCFRAKPTNTKKFFYPLT